MATTSQHVQQVAFDKKKSLTKKAVMSLLPGTWVEVKWLDAPNNILLLLEKPENRPGDVMLKLFDPASKYAPMGARATHDQVVSVVGTLTVPLKEEFDLPRKKAGKFDPEATAREVAKRTNF